MLSPARLRANRLNAQKSTGPRTPEGKARASRNALKHGLSSCGTGSSAPGALRRASVRPASEPDPEALATALARGSRDPAILAAAGALAAAWCWLERCENALGQHIQACAGASPAPAAPAEAAPQGRPPGRREHANAADDAQKAEAGGGMTMPSAGQQEASPTAQLALLERYRRRAIRQVHLAMRDFARLRPGGSDLNPDGGESHAKGSMSAMGSRQTKQCGTDARPPGRAAGNGKDAGGDALRHRKASGDIPGQAARLAKGSQSSFVASARTQPGLPLLGRDTWPRGPERLPHAGLADEQLKYAALIAASATDT